MRLVLDFSNARQGKCHSYGGVLASIDGGTPLAVTISHDGCSMGDVDGPTTDCGTPVVDRQQAWTVAMLLTRRESVKPAGESFWDPQTRRMSFPLKSETRAWIM